MVPKLRICPPALSLFSRSAAGVITLSSAAQTNDLANLERLLELEKAQHPELNYLNPCTHAMREAAEMAARHNHPVALALLLDSGCYESADVVFAAIAEKSKDVLESLISRGWDINSCYDYHGDVLQFVYPDLL